MTTQTSTPNDLNHYPNQISLRLFGRQALFTDPITRIGGEKTSYHLPTYEAIKGVLKSIYWKPTLTWHVDRLRVIKPIQTQTKGTKPLQWDGGNTLAYYTFLQDVEYQVEAHFEWNLHQPNLAADRIDGKHFAMAQRALEKGGRQDIFLGTRDCQGYVEPCEFGSGTGFYDAIPQLGYGMMFHSFGYPGEIGGDHLIRRLWRDAVLNNGILTFPRTDDPGLIVQTVRAMSSRHYGLGESVRAVAEELES